MGFKKLLKSLLINKHFLVLLLLSIITSFVNIKFLDIVRNAPSISQLHVIYYVFSVVLIYFCSVLSFFISDRYTELFISNYFIEINKLRRKNEDVSNGALFSTEVTRIIYNISYPIIDSFCKIIFIISIVYFVLSNTFDVIITLKYWITSFILTIILVLLISSKLIKKRGELLSVLHSNRLTHVINTENLYYLLKFKFIRSNILSSYHNLILKSTINRTILSSITSATKPIIELVCILLFALFLTTTSTDPSLVASISFAGIRILPFISQVITNVSTIRGHLISFENYIYIQKKTSPLALNTENKFIHVKGNSGCGKSYLFEYINSSGVIINEKLYQPNDIYFIKTKPIFECEYFSYESENAEVSNLITELNLENLIDKRYKNFSTGELVRLDFLRAQNTNAKIYLIDESFSNLNLDYCLKLFNHLKNNNSIEFIFYTSHTQTDFINDYSIIDLNKDDKFSYNTLSKRSFSQ